MNCKPGDLATVVNGLSGPRSTNIGKIVTVISSSGNHPAFGPCWLVKLSSATTFYRTSRKGAAKGLAGFSDEGDCPDAWLRPINRPSDDAQDESAAWLPPVPTSREQEAA